jgi:hypothetical protein
MYTTQLQMVNKMLEILMFATWASLIGYAVWFFTAAKHYAPITPDEAKILWKIHKQRLQCASTRWRPVKRGNHVIGFECECGFMHVQRRPLVSSAPALPVRPQRSHTSTITKLNTACKTK